MKLKARKTVFVVLGVLLLGFLFCAYQFHYRWKWAVMEYKMELIAKGEILDVTKLIPKPVPPEENSADTFRKVMVLLTNENQILIWNPPHSMQMVAPGKAMIGWTLSDVRGDSTNTWVEEEIALNQDREALALLQKIRGCPKLDFQLEYNRGWMMLLRHLVPLKKSTQRLSAAAECDLHQRSIASATTNILSALALVKGMEDEPTAISQLVRIAMAQIVMSASWDLLQSANATDEQLAILQKNWEELEFISAGERALLMERATGDAMVVQLVTSGGEVRRMFGNIHRSTEEQKDLAGTLSEWWGSTKDAGRELWWRWAWSYPDELRGLEATKF